MSAAIFVILRAELLRQQRIVMSDWRGPYDLYSHADIWRQPAGTRPLEVVWVRELNRGRMWLEIRPYFLRFMAMVMLLLVVAALAMSVRMATAPLSCFMSQTVNDRLTCYVRVVPQPYERKAHGNSS